MDEMCLVTGGAGFIGCALSPSLVSRYSRVIAVDSLHPQVHKHRTRPRALAAGVELLEGDVADPKVWDRVLAGIKPQTVIHLAAETGTGQSLTEATRHAQTNVVGTAVMLDALARHDAVPERMLLSSSRAVYGEGAWRTRHGENVYPGQRSRDQLGRAEWDFAELEALPSTSEATRPMPVSIYGATKLAQEHMLTSWATAFGTTAIVLRLQNVYGPGQSLSNPYTGIVSLFCQLARNGESIPLYEDGRMLRDFVLIDDVVGAFMCAADPAITTALPIDVGTGRSVSIAELAGHVAHTYGAPMPHVCGKYRFGDVRHASCMVDRTLTVLPWRPRVEVAEGVALLTAWVDAQLAAPDPPG